MICVEINVLRTITLSDFRVNLSRVRFAIAQGELYQVVYYQEPVAYCTSIDQVCADWKVETLSVRAFREKLNNCYERLLSKELDAFLVQVRGEPRMAFVGVHRAGFLKGFEE